MIEGAIRFVVFAAPRTGSNLLCGLLNAHPDIRCHHGLFNPAGVHWARDLAVPDTIPSAPAERDRDPLAFLDAIWAGGGGARATGFKMNRGENAQALDALLRDPRVRKILLRRRDRIRTYVSEEIAKRTGIWESYAPADAPVPSIRVEAEALLRHAALNEAFYAEIEAVLEATAQVWLECDYEALADPEEMAAILAFLGLEPPADLVATSWKRAPPELGAMVANLDELVRALRGTALFDDLRRQDAPDLHSLQFSR